MTAGYNEGNVAVTTIDSAARWCAIKPVTLATLTTIIGLALSGCGNSLPILGGTTDTALTQPGLNPGAAAGQRTAATKIALAPVIGAPDRVGKQIQSQLSAALGQRNIQIVDPANSASSTYTLRGYVVSAKEARGTKVSYIWDVTDKSGKRVNRITGEEMAPAINSRDPWTSVTPQITQAIATKTASSLAAWLPSQAPTPPPAIASNSAPQQPAGVARPVVPTATGPAATTPTASPQTAALNAAPSAVLAIVPAVSGAPGDGGVSLTAAIQRELQRSGVRLTPTAAPGSAYRVEGVVKLGAADKGRQPIQIDWNVKDPNGKKLGTVSQKNKIPAGSLNGAWGATANAAAAAATQGILKLLPKDGQASASRATTSSGTY